MDQANTLRKLLGQNRTCIVPVMGDMKMDYAACLMRLVLEHQACLKHTSVLFDGSNQGLPHAMAVSGRVDLLNFFNGQASLEDLVLQLDEGQYLVPANLGLQALTQRPSWAGALLGNLHRLPVTADRFYATLPYEAVALAHGLCPDEAWHWVVHPTSSSVTRVFQAIRTSKEVDQNIRHRVIVAGVKNAEEADHVFSNLLESTAGFMAQPLQYAGHLPMLVPGRPLNQVGREMIAAGRRIAKAICSLEEHALA
ncbi:MAG TPA: hypothetical protein VFV43_07650 [Limnobacter sp.]|nr:hypothetical protein [Limnobacter sp.]